MEIDAESLPDLLEILFWTARCDPGVPEYIFLFDKDGQIRINLCKYGNLHLTEFNQEQLTTGNLTTLGWDIIEGPEVDPFTDGGQIEGRQIRI